MVPIDASPTGTVGLVEIRLARPADAEAIRRIYNA